MAEGRKVMVIGLDGATFDLIDPWMQKGRLPHIAGLIRQGVRGTLKSTIHPASPPAWSSFMTGKNPGKHGIFQFMRRVEGQYRWQVNSASDRRARSLWSILSKHGKGVGVLHVPLTYPPEPVAGFMVSGLGAPRPESDFVLPRELKRELLDSLGQRSLVVERASVRTDRLEYLGYLHRMVESTEEQAHFLLDRYPDLDFMIVVFAATDRVQHFYWKEMDPTHPQHDPSQPDELRNAILSVYEHLDAAIGNLLDRADDRTHIVVMSDHGAGPYRKMIHLNNWLEASGFLRWRADNAATTSRPAGKLKQWIHSVYARDLAPHLSPNRRRLVRRIVPRFLKSQRKTRADDSSLHQVNWANTLAYSEGPDGNIYINLKGREPQGIVDPGDQERVLREIETRLLRLKDPDTDEAVVGTIHRREDLYHGPFMAEAPDLIIEWRDYLYHTRPMASERRLGVFSPPQPWPGGLEHSAHHRPEGILILSGPHFQRGKEIAGAEIVDLAPTILHLLGLPVPRDMDGRVLVEPLSETFQEVYPVVFVDRGIVAGAEKRKGYNAQEDEEVKETLRGLGYLD